MGRIVNCTYCGEEIERNCVSRTGKYSCYGCKQAYQTAYAKRQRELKKSKLGLETIPYNVDTWWEEIHKPL